MNGSTLNLYDFYQGVVEVLTKGWPLAAFLAALLLRHQLRDVLQRLRQFKADRVGEVNFDPHVAPLPEGHAMPSGAQPRPEEVRRSALPTDPAKKESEKPNPWCRSGNVYWLGNNILTVALALLNGQLDVARRELGNAIKHAQQLPLPDLVVARLQQVLVMDLTDPGERGLATNKLFELGVQVGRFVEKHQPGFPGWAEIT